MNDAASIVAWPEDPAEAVVYELRQDYLSSSRVGLFTTIEKAKDVAAQVIETYREFDGEEGTEGLISDPVWEMRRWKFGDREVGEEQPCLTYGMQGSSFRIVTIKLDEVRQPDGTVLTPSKTS